ncbi:MAG: AAA family ATPase [Desulfobacterium sp.]|nr:AAA family ATPase [Desulfobacterium sp.]
MKKIFIETRFVLAFREAISVVKDVEQGQPGLMVVWGHPGRGKTECAREYAVRDMDSVYLRVMQDWTARGMLSALCCEINEMEPGTVERCKKILVGELEEHPRAILVDEADRLSLGNIEHLRDIHDMTGAPIVFIGEPSIYAAINARKRIWSRVTKTVEFGKLAAQDAAIFGLKAANLKIEAEAAQKLITRCGGDFRLLWQDMRDLERLARANNTQEVTIGLILKLKDRKQTPRGSRS